MTTPAPAPAPVECRGLNCACATLEGPWRLIGGYDTHMVCGHTKGAHTAPKAATKQIRRQR